jgi:transposase-like protein
MPARTRSRRHSGRKLPGISQHNFGRKPFYKEHRETYVEPPATAAAESPSENNAFLFCHNAKALSLSTAESLSEDAALAAFKAIRWFESGGEPVCQHCGADRPYEIAGRQLWRCRECRADFSATSGTLFSSHKMSFQTICVALAITVGATSTISPDRHMVTMRRALGINWRSCFSLLNKIRKAAHLEPLVDKPPIEIGRNAFCNGALYNTRTWWSEEEKKALEKFIKVGYSPDDVAPTLGRSPKSMAHYARDHGIILPKEWSSLIAAKRIATPRRVALSYPFISTRRPEHADLLALNDLVPRAYPEHMRADICQEMMLAVIEGAVTVEEIKANHEKSAWFLKKFYMANYEDSGRAVSLNARDGDDERAYDEAASSLAAQDWHANEVHERTRYVNAMSVTFQPPTQIDDVWRSQISRVRRGLGAQGKFYSFGETVDVMERGYRLRDDPTYQRSHGLQRAEERYGLRLDRRAIKEIVDRIEGGLCEVVEEESDDKVYVNVAYGGRMLPIVYRRSSKTIVTVLPTPHQPGHRSVKISGWQAP